MPIGEIGRYEKHFKIFIIHFYILFDAGCGSQNSFAELAEGADYAVLQKSAPGYEDTVFEVFSYDCPFCYKYDKAVLPQFILKLKPSLKFTYWHLQSKGTYASAANELFAALITKDEKAGL